MPAGTTMSTQLLLFSPLRKAIKTKKKESWNLQGRYQFQGLPISVENKAGSYRRGQDKDGHKWKTFMHFDYGYVRNTLAKDGDAVDVYVNRKSKGIREDYHGENEGLVATDVYVVHQKKIEFSGKWPNGICPDCKKHHSECNCAKYYDEDKVMLGFDSKDDAVAAYLRQYDSKRFLGPVSTYTIDEFKAALKRSFGKKLPNKKPKFEHWYGYDFDGTMVKDEGWKGKEHAGEPIQKTIDRINKRLNAGQKVKILTARASDPKAIPFIKEYLKQNNIPLLEITDRKDPGMVSLEDDRAVQVRKNTGNLVKSISTTYYLDLDKLYGSEMEKACSEKPAMRPSKMVVAKKSYLGQPGDQGGSHAMLRENMGPKILHHTMGDVLDEIEKSYIYKCLPGEDMQAYTARFMREHSSNQVQAMLDRPQNGELVKAFVRAHQRKGKTVGPYFNKRTKKVTHVKHTKLLGLDLSGKDAKEKVAALHKKKEHHDLHIDAANEMKSKVEAHKQAGNTSYKVGEKDHHVDKVLKDLNDHISHHSNENRSHDNHIKKIESRHETVAKQWEEKKKVKKEAKAHDKAKALIRDTLGSDKLTEGDVHRVMLAAKQKGDDSYAHINNFLMGTRPDLKDAVNQAGIKLDAMPDEPKKADEIFTEKVRAEKQPWEQTKSEYVDNDESQKKAKEIHIKAMESLGGSDRWGETRRFSGKASGNRLEKVDKAQGRWSKAYDRAEAKHKKEIENAVKKGKVIPADVLKDYPEIKSESPQKADVISQMIKDGHHEGEKFSDDLVGVLKRMKSDDKPKVEKKVVVKKKSKKEVKRNDLVDFIKHQINYDISKHIYDDFSDSKGLYVHIKDIPPNAKNAIQRLANQYPNIYKTEEGGAGAWWLSFGKEKPVIKKPEKKVVVKKEPKMDPDKENAISKPWTVSGDRYAFLTENVMKPSPGLDPSVSLHQLSSMSERAKKNRADERVKEKGDDRKKYNTAVEKWGKDVWDAYVSGKFNSNDVFDTDAFYVLSEKLGDKIISPFKLSQKDEAERVKYLSGIDKETRGTDPSRTPKKVVVPKESKEEYSKRLKRMMEERTGKKDVAAKQFSPSVGDTVYLHWVSSGKMEPVNYRGRTGDQAMIVKDGSQMFVPFGDIKPSPGKEVKQEEKMKEPTKAMEWHPLRTHPLDYINVPLEDRKGSPVKITRDQKNNFVVTVGDERNIFGDVISTSGFLYKEGVGLPTKQSKSA